MTTTIGERSKQEAEAFKARAWYRDLANMTFGLGEYRTSDGRRDKMRHELREMRAMRAERKTLPRWTHIDSIALLCGVHLGENKEEEINAMLEMLRLQIPDLFSWYEASDGHYPSADVPTESLGSFSNGEAWKEILEQQLALAESSTLDKE